jgi:hypothetical protein
MVFRLTDIVLKTMAPLLVVSLLSCQPSVSDGGLETTNGFITAYVDNGVVFGSAQPGTKLYLCDPAYNPFDSSFAPPEFCSADENGSFSFGPVPEGSYSLCAWFDPKNQATFMQNISVSGEGALFPDTLYFTATGIITGIAAISEIPNTTIQISLVGTPLSVATDNEGSFTIEKAPAGTCTLLAHYSDTLRGGINLHEATQTVTVQPKGKVTAELTLLYIP